jgi:hypothetical protein
LPRTKRDGTPVEYTLRYDIDDVSVVSVFHDADWVCDVENQKLVQADGSLLPMSFWELQMFKRSSRTLAELNADDMPDWYERYIEQQELKKRRRKDKRAAEKKRRKDKANDNPTPDSPAPTAKPKAPKGRASNPDKTDALADFLGDPEGDE